MLVFAGVILLLFGILGQFLINKGRMIRLMSAAVTLLMLLLCSADAVKSVFIVLLVADVIAAAAGKWTGCTAAALMEVLSGVVCVILGIPELFQTWGILPGVLIVVIVLIELLIAAFLTVTTLFPARIMRYVRDNLMHNGNTFDAVQEEKDLSDGIKVLSNLRYDEILPNGFLDVYYPKKSMPSMPLTVIYIHGGGYIWGDKVTGDPNGGSGELENSTVWELVCAGYPVVSMNYTLAPEYPYPAAILQLNRGLEWLRDNGAAFGLSTQRVVLLGASAGGNLAGVLANIQTNPDYAAKMNLKSVFRSGELKAVMFEGGLMDNRRFGITHNVAFDFVFYHMGRVYLGVNELLTSRKADLSNVTDHITKNFPPSFISDGNTATFFDQASELDDLLRELGVYTELSIFPVHQAGKLIHGFEETDSLWGKETRQKMLRFLEKISEPAAKETVQ